MSDTLLESKENSAEEECRCCCCTGDCRMEVSELSNSEKRALAILDLRALISNCREDN